MATRNKRTLRFIQTNYLERKRILVTTTVGTTPTDSEILSAELFKQFLALFSNRFDSSVRKGEFGAWRQISRFHFLTDDEISSAINGMSDLQRAFKLDVQNRFVIINISQNPTNSGLTSRVHQRLNDIGLKPKLYKFFDQDYIYIFLSEDVDCASGMNLLNDWCQANISELDLATLKVLSKDDSIPFPLQKGFSSAATCAQTQNELLRSFINDTDSGVTFDSYLSILTGPSDQKEIQQYKQNAQVCSTNFWDFVESAADAEQTSLFSVSPVQVEHHSIEATSGDRCIDLNLSFAPESRQPGQTRQSEFNNRHSLHVALDPVEKPSKQVCIFPVVDDEEPADATLYSGDNEGPSRQTNNDQEGQITIPAHSNILPQVSRQMGEQHEKSSPRVQSERIPHTVSVTPRNSSKRTRANSKPLKESKQLSLKLLEQRETRAPP
ncbi:hypothetical protein BH10CYA1_BH10CYA1_62780 [soil metagenome]